MFGSLAEGFDVVFGSLAEGFDVGFGGEILFEQPRLLTHDGFGLAFGHAGVHQFVDRRMSVEDEGI